jgi:hypothetical protein
MAERASEHTWTYRTRTYVSLSNFSGERHLESFADRGRKLLCVSTTSSISGGNWGSGNIPTDDAISGLQQANSAGKAWHRYKTMIRTSKVERRASQSRSDSEAALSLAAPWALGEPLPSWTPRIGASDANHLSRKCG